MAEQHTRKFQVTNQSYQGPPTLKNFPLNDNPQFTALISSDPQFSLKDKKPNMLMDMGSYVEGKVT